MLFTGSVLDKGQPKSSRGANQLCKKGVIKISSSKVFRFLEKKTLAKIHQSTSSGAMTAPMWRSALVVVCTTVLLTSLNAEMAEAAEVTEVATMDSGRKLFDGLPKEDLPILTQKGLSVMDQMALANSEVMDESSKNLKRLSTPWKTDISEPLSTPYPASNAPRESRGLERRYS